MANDPTSTTPGTTAQTPAVTPTYVTPTDDDFKKVENWTDLFKKGQDQFVSYNSIATATGGILDGLTKGIGSLGGSFERLDALTETQSAKFGLLGTAVLGAKSQFDNLNAGLDTGRLSTFSDQFKGLFDTLDTAKTSGLLLPAIDKMGSAISGLGVPIDLIKSKMNEGVSVFSNWAKGVLQTADDQLKLQNATIQLAAAGGNLNYVYDKAGAGFQNMNAFLGDQEKMFSAVGRTTGLTTEQINGYSAALQKVPGALKEMLDDTGKVSGSTNILADTIKFATGSGRDYSSVVADMNRAVNEYGVSLNTALEFTSRITDISNKYGAQVEDVRNSLLGSAYAFKMFTAGEADAGKMTQNLSEVMNEYVGRLTSIGVPAQNAIGLFNEMSGAISSMGVANKSFLSSQTGGPGGLLGALQIDKMLKAEDIKGVFDKVQQEMKKLTGPTITLDQVNTQQDAARYERQRMILQQGPLGKFAQDDKEADRLIEAMSKGVVPKELGNAQEGLKSTIEKGSQIEQLSYTKMSEINTNVEAIRMAMGNSNLTLLQGASTARTGATTAAASQNTIRATALQDYKSESQKIGTNSLQVDAINNLGTTIKDLPSSIAGTGKTIKNSLFPETNAKPISDSQIREAYRQKQMDIYNTQEAPLSKKLQLTDLDKQEKSALAAEQVRNAVNNNVRNNRANQTPNNVNQNNGQINNGPVPVVLAGNSQLSVILNSTCPHCGTKTQTSQHGQIFNKGN